MKKYLVIAICILIGTSIFFSCSNCSNKIDHNTKDTVPAFTKDDTTKVLQLTETYLNHMKNKEYDQGLSMLRTIINDSIMPLSEDIKNNIRIQQKNFPVLNFKLSNIEFINANQVSVTYTIEFFEKAPGDDIPNTIRMTFSPQKIKDEWYIELNEKSHIK